MAAKAYSLFPIEDPEASKARAFFPKAAEAGNVPAKIRMVWYDLQDNDSPESKEAALRKVEAWASEGNAGAAFSANVMLAQGFGGKARIPEGFDNLLQKADAGDADAQFAIGDAYFEGKIIAQDYNKKAVEYYKRAAASHHPPALLSLGICHAHGFGVERSMNKAIRLWLAAADLGDRDAMHNIANAYLRGTGVPRDFDAAIRWYKLSAAAGCAESMVAHGMILTDSPDTSMEQKMEGLRMICNASDLGNAMANFIVAKGLMSDKPGPLKRNFALGLKCLQKSAQADNPAAQLELAGLLRTGHPEGVRKDRIEALKWTLLATPIAPRDSAGMLARLQQEMSPQEISSAVTRAQGFVPVNLDVTIQGKRHFIPKQAP